VNCAQSGKAANDNTRRDSDMPIILGTHEFAFDRNETVEVTLVGRVIERKDTPKGNAYWIEQDLPDGRTARQWFKERDVYPSDAPARRVAA
jgi:hypothetical protein